MGSQIDALFRTAKLWRAEAEKLREILLGCGLDEEKKWGKPCYGYDGKNIAIIQRMNDFLALLFFKGALLKDPGGLLERQGPHSRAGYRLRFTSVEQVAKQKAAIEALVREAIAVEKAGLSVPKAPPPDLPEELLEKFDEDPALKEAFENLTPGRQKGYILHFGAAKQAQTRRARIEKYRDQILDGLGLHDR